MVISDMLAKRRAIMRVVAKEDYDIIMEVIMTSSSALGDGDTVVLDVI